LLCAAVFAAYWAKKIGERQNKIDEQLLKTQEKTFDAQNFVDIAVSLRLVLDEGKKTKYMNGGEFYFGPWEFSLENVGSYPAYLTRYTLQADHYNDVQIKGSMPIPSAGYRIKLPPDIVQTLLLTIDFEDHLGRKWRSVHTGTYSEVDGFWQLSSEKKKLITD